MRDYLLDSMELGHDCQVYSILDKTNNELTIVCVDSPKELAYHKNFPMNLKAGEGDTVFCSDENPLDEMEIIRIK